MGEEFFADFSFVADAMRSGADDSLDDLHLRKTDVENAAAQGAKVEAKLRMTRPATPSGS